MIVPDINLLVYAHNAADSEHLAAREWWEQSINGGEPIGLAWVVVGGFIRLMTHPRILENPMAVGDATACVRAWLAEESVILLEPGRRFPMIFFDYLEKLGSAGNLTTAAQIAALALEKQAEVYSCDSDFARFEGIQWTNPLAK